MKKEDILKAIKTRIKYLGIVGGVDSCSVDTISDMVSNISNSSQELMAFENCEQESVEEFKRLSIELCVDIIIMNMRIDDFQINGMTTIDKSIMPKFPFGGFINTPVMRDEKFDAMSVLNGSMLKKNEFNCVEDGEIRISSDVVVSDIYMAFRENYSHMIDTVKKLSRGDTACINGLYNVIVNNNRPGIATEMEKIGLSGRSHCLGFIASLCKCDIRKMDAIISAFKEGVISAYDIRIESVERRGKRFSACYIFDNYK